MAIFEPDAFHTLRLRPGNRWEVIHYPYSVRARKWADSRNWVERGYFRFPCPPAPIRVNSAKLRIQLVYTWAKHSWEVGWECCVDLVRLTDLPSSGFTDETFDVILTGRIYHKGGAFRWEWHEGDATSAFENAVNTGARKIVLQVGRGFHWAKGCWHAYWDWAHPSFEVDYVSGPMPPWPVGIRYLRANALRVMWTDVNSGPFQEEAYEIERSESGGEWKKVHTSKADETWWEDTNVAADRYYRYRIRAKNRLRNSDWATTPVIFTDPIPSGVSIRERFWTSNDLRSWEGPIENLADAKSSRYLKWQLDAEISPAINPDAPNWTPRFYSKVIRFRPA